MEEQVAGLSPNYTLIAFLLITIIPTAIILILQTLNKKRASPPGPWKLPIIGNLHQMVLGNPLPHRCLRDLATRYGPLMHLQLGEASTVIVSSPELAKEFLHTNDLNFATRPYLPSAYTILYQGRDIAFGPYTEYWRQMRKICAQELLSPKRVKSLVPVIIEEVDEFVNISRMLYSLGNSVISRAAFGKIQKHWEAFFPVQREIIKALQGASLWDVYPSSKLVCLLTGAETKLKKLHKEADAILQMIIDDHIATRSARKEDLVDVLLNHTVDQDLEIPITNRDIKAVLLDIFLAGSDTPSIAIEWALSELMRNSQAMEKAQREVRKQVGQKGRIDHEDLGQLHYLKLVIKEALRLHPPAPLLAPREAREAAVIHGYQIPAKTRIIINAWAIARDHRNWVKPDSFFPERFMLDDQGRGDYLKGLDFSMIPFGSGRRICPGIQYGTTLVTLCLANLVYHFDWELPTAQNLDMSEDFGIGVRRKNELFLIPVPYHTVRE
ncbi:Desmethyl-deoxy-podophyllotoxin synthase [Linum perenne]